MTNTPIETANDNILPSDAHMAMQKMIKISNELVTVAETETQKLVQDDMLGFAMLQDEKEVLLNHYVKASQEFQERLEDFRGLDKRLLDRLDVAQKALGERTKSNNIIVKRMNTKSEQKTMDSLLAAQEIAQTVHTNFPEPDMGKVAQNSQVKH